MRLKELLRVLITTEMEDISVYEVEAEAFGEAPGHGTAIRGLFLGLAEEKRDRLKTLRRISKDGIGFRQRKTEAARSIEASLRAHAARAERSAALYTSLLKELHKPEYKEAVADMLTGERRFLEDLRALQKRIKRP
ncbi:MAG: hypothetical protein COT18_12485 [Elusimicrobia bacterium CG08_land_8_20_14_0_20_59_10]|nr:MAG: hypothetical protein COT18_12485 [Elusimicrobia bacterium CG08_land_8_20_14_0_20_59_10]